MTKNPTKLDFFHPLIQLLTKYDSEIIILLNNKFEIMLFNPAAENIFSCLATENIGKRLDTVFPLLAMENLIKNYEIKAKDNRILPNPIFNNLHETVNDIQLSWTMFYTKIDNDCFFMLKAAKLEEKTKQDEIIRLETLVENMPCNVYWMDKNCIMVGCNRNVLSMLNMNHEDYVGKTYEELSEICHWPPGLAQKLKNDDLTVLKTGQPIFGIEDPPLPHANNTFLHLLTSRVPIRNNAGKIIGVAGISVDISELKRARERAEAASQAKSTFLQNMRHDLRTPLTGIVGFARLIESEVTDPTIKEYAGNLASSSESLLNILNEILDAIRLASGAIPIQKNKFSLKEKLRSIVNLNQAKADEKKLILSLDYDAAIPDYFVGDYKRIQRIILELLANALKFTEKGDVKITAKLEKPDTTHPIIKIVITDTGIGIPENKREEIFGSFNRLHDSHQGIFQGIGLGLTIARQFMEDLGGEIYVESIEGKGSKFTCIFPLQIALIQDDSNVEKSTNTLVLKDFSPSNAKNIVSTHTVESDENSTAIKILVVEDNFIAVKVVSAILEDLGCQVDVAKNGHAAIELAKSNTYGLIFMDVGLPDMDGNEVTRAIRDWENQFEQHTPIIGLTAHVEAEDKQNCIQAGMDAVLSKPLKPEMAEDLLKAFIPKFAEDKKVEEAPKTVFEQLGLPEKKEEFFKLPEKAIDFDIISKTSGGAKNWAREVLPELAADIQLEAEKIKTAYAEKNWQVVQDLTHKMKGGALCCGTVRLEKACFYLERYLRAEQTELREALYEQLLKEITGTVKAINKWIKN